MERKKRHLKPTLVAFTSLALLATGCSEHSDEPTPGIKAKSGQAISFSSNAGAVSRSIYSEDDEYQIHWVNGDELNIFSNEAWVGTPGTDNADPVILPKEHVAGYKVTEAKDTLTHGFINPLDPDQMMLWSSHDADHTFYAVYPKSRNISITETISMQYHTNQQCAGMQSDGNGNYTTKPDMRNAYMVAKNKVSAANTAHVLLNFDPIMTTLDLTVTAGKYEVGTGIIQPITVTGVSVIMPKYLKNGEFIYDMNAGVDTSTGHADGGWHLTTVEEGTESVFVGIVDDRDGAKNHYLDLFEGETLKLMAFLPPMDVDKYQIKIHTTSGYDFVKTVSGTDISNTINKRSRIKITLPNIYPDGAEYIGEGTEAKSGNSWMSRLPESTPITKLSIPGYKCSKDITVQQLQYLLNHGVRAFDLDEFGKYNLAVQYDFDMDAKLISVFDDFIKEHKGETLFVWINTSSGLAHWKQLPSNWSAAPDNFLSTTLADKNVRGNILAFEVHSNSFIPAQGTTKSPKFFNYNNTDKLSFDGDWKCHYLKDGNNKTVFNSLFPTDINNELPQTGYTGIVMIPDADKAYKDGAYTYSDFLIQGIIDCNYKFNLRKK